MGMFANLFERKPLCDDHGIHASIEAQAPRVVL